MYIDHSSAPTIGPLPLILADITKFLDGFTGLPALANMSANYFFHASYIQCYFEESLLVFVLCGRGGRGGGDVSN